MTLARAARWRPATIGWVIVSACALLPEPDVTVNTLRSHTFALDSAGVVFDLGRGVRAAQQPGVCFSIDTSRYVLRPQATQGVPLQLTDTTLRTRNAGAGAGTPITLRAALEGADGVLVDSHGGAYGPDESGERLCVRWTGLRPGMTYVRLHVRSTPPIVVDNMTWRFFTRL
jgi:hypothetical protein